MIPQRIEEIKIYEKNLLSILHGNVDDIFVGLDCIKYSLERILYLYLKKERFSSVIFYDVKDGLFSYSEKDLQIALEKTDHNKELNNRGVNIRNRKRKSPFENSELEKQPEVEGNKMAYESFRRFGNPAYKSRITKVNSAISQLLEKNDYRCALVVQQAFLASTNKNNSVSKSIFADETLTATLLSYNAQGNNLQGHRIIFNYGTQENFLYNDLDKEIGNQLFNTSSENISNSTVRILKPNCDIHIGAPHFDELLSLINYHRLNQGKKVTWYNIENLVSQLVLCNNSISEWEDCFNEINQIDAEEINSKLGLKLSIDKSIPLEALNKLTGLSGVKSFFKELVANVQYDIQLAELKNKPVEISYGLHMVFTGNPGTGKTTVARLVGEIFKSLGILQRGHCVEGDRSSLVAGFQGQSAIKTKKLVESAIDGVLFIDEAYNLINGPSDNFGNEASTTLLKLMEDNLGKQVVVIAGYTNEINDFIDTNPGYSSRFNTYINFEDFNIEECCEIFENLASNLNYILEPGTKSIYQSLLKSKINKRKGYDNARGVRKVWGDVLSKHKKRIIEEGKKGIQHNLEQRLTITKQDLEAENLEIQDVEISLDALNKLTGLSGVKSFFKELVANVQYDIQLAELENKPVEISYGLHMVFTGNPGTGKTTVARLVGEIFKSLGILQRGHCVEGDRSSLVAGFQGQSAIKTKKLVESAFDGVLFIDEAYNLINGPSDDFGNEASTTLLKLMEDNLGKQVVVIAGYTNEINDFIDTNPGYSSRFNSYINFEDFNIEECCEIFENLASNLKYILEPGTKSIYQSLLKSKINKQKGYDNARGVRKVWGDVLSKHKKRIIEEGKKGIQHNLEQRLTITTQDFDSELLVKDKNEHLTQSSSKIILKFNYEAASEIWNMSQAIGMILLDNGSAGTGTCFAISEDGLIMTCNHCIPSNSSITISLNEKKYKNIETLYKNERLDIAILRMKDVTNMPYLNLTSSLMGLKMGAKIGLLAFPKGFELGQEVSYTEGTVSKKEGIHYHHTANATHGSSGGAFFDLETKTVFGILNGGFGEEGANINVAVELIQLYKEDDIEIEFI